MDKLYGEKFKNLILYILANDDYRDSGIKKLNKILYFIDFYFYRDNESLISGMRYAKADMGPIIDNYKNIFSQMVEDGLLEQLKISGVIYHKPKEEPDISCFSAQEIDHIHNILEKYGRLSSAELEGISHCQQPWVLTEHMGEIIDPDLALLIGASEEGEEGIVENEELKDELTKLASSVS